MDFIIGLGGLNPTTKRLGGTLDHGGGENLEHGGSGKKQAIAAAAALLALASAGQKMEHHHGGLSMCNSAILSTWLVFGRQRRDYHKTPKLAGENPGRTQTTGACPVGAGSGLPGET
jgi:hypothetical protein